MLDLVAQLDSDSEVLLVGEHRLRIAARGVFGRERTLGVVLSGYAEGRGEGPEDYLSELLLAPENSEATYQVIDRWGLLACKALRSDHPSYRRVRGRSSRGRLSQGEYYHHDGCSGPTKPRVVEIRCPYQAVPRRVATAIAPFEPTVYAMIRHGAEHLSADAELTPWRERVDGGAPLVDDELDLVQGLVTRAVRRELSAEAARAFFRQIDELAFAYREPWEMGESRLIANAHPSSGQAGTMQHRRAHLTPHTGGVANGELVKRWPAEELPYAGPSSPGSCSTCAEP